MFAEVEDSFAGLEQQGRPPRADLSDGSLMTRLVVNSDVVTDVLGAESSYALNTKVIDGTQSARSAIGLYESPVLFYFYCTWIRGDDDCSEV